MKPDNDGQNLLFLKKIQNKEISNPSVSLQYTQLFEMRNLLDNPKDSIKIKEIMVPCLTNYFESICGEVAFKMETYVVVEDNETLTNFSRLSRSSPFGYLTIRFQRFCISYSS